MLEKWLSKPSKSLISWSFRGALPTWTPKQGFDPQQIVQYPAPNQKSWIAPD
ncbi:hypothetical protein DPMN_136392 [Dreissena polymorpha]|uniref:Uncharacterized protein n=1 Tax=Dreissena polymorpha TaxID=45954 RepID=A0A9D4FZP0_DREPO|nr:hypothetical protein DPMN_136392 [Dreissena polymorpha]